MFYLILAVISSSLVSITMRIGEDRVKDNISMLSVNYFICMVLSFFYTGVNNLFQTGSGLEVAIGLGGINGFFYISSLVLFQNSVGKNGLVLSSIFMKLGIIMPLIISITLFQEKPTLMQLLGFVIAILAIVLINIRKSSDKQRTESGNRINARIGLLFVLIGCGMSDGMSKVYRELGTDQFEELFLAFTFVIAFFLSLLLVKVKKQKITKQELFYGAMLGIPNYFSARFLLKSLGEIPAVVAYPTFSIGTIAIITLTGMIVFKEKITKLQLFAIGLIAIAVVLLN